MLGLLCSSASHLGEAQGHQGVSDPYAISFSIQSLEQGTGSTTLSSLARVQLWCCQLQPLQLPPLQPVQTESEIPNTESLVLESVAQPHLVVSVPGQTRLSIPPGAANTEQMHEEQGCISFSLCPGC